MSRPVIAIFGFVQIAMGIVGITALINGQWLMAIAALAGVFVVGVLVNRVRKVTEAAGDGQGAQDGPGRVDQALDFLRRNRYVAANGTIRAAVAQLREGGDETMLTQALTLQSATLAVVGDQDGAHEALAELAERMAAVPLDFSPESVRMREAQALVQRELDRGLPDPNRLAHEFLSVYDPTLH